MKAENLDDAQKHMKEINAVSQARANVVKSQRRCELIETHYWSCLFDTHRHRTLSTATRCIEDNITKKKLHKWRRWEIIDVFERALNGEALSLIGKHYGVSGNRIAHYVQSMSRKIQYRLGSNQEEFPDCYDSLNNLRLHKAFWLRQLEKLKNESL